MQQSILLEPCLIFILQFSQIKYNAACLSNLQFLEPVQFTKIVLYKRFLVQAN